MSLDLENLKDNRDEIIKAEIVSLLFLIEKTFLKWWQNNGYFSTESPLYNNPRREIKNLFENKFQNIKIDISKIINNYRESENEINLWQHFFKEWRRWRGNNPNQITSQLKILQKLYGHCEGLNSGIEKGNPKENIIGEYPYISNVFGKFEFFCHSDNFDKKRDCIKDELLNCLDKLADESSDNINRNNFISLVKRLYQYLPSDTRFPLNDVNLWEQAFMATSMFKALLSESYLKPIDTNIYDLSQIRWCILGIQYDKLTLVEKGLKPAHIQYYRNITKEIDDKIKTEIEFIYALGNEVYRDETGIYFLVSQNLKGNKNRNFYELNSELNEIKNKILEIFQNKVKDEFYPTILLSESTKATMNLTSLLQNAKEDFLKANYSKKNQISISNSDKYIDICQVCKDKLVKKEENNENKKENDKVLICDICKDRKNGRVINWLNNQSDETIWIGELADKNNRVALVNLKFELIEWLNGSLLSSLVNQKLDLSIEYESYINDIFNTLKNNKNLDETIYLQFYSENINPKNQLLRTIVETWFIERVVGTIYEEKIKNIFNIDSLNNLDWNNLNDDKLKSLSKIILQFILRKNPSPARLRRVWESTKNFFKEVKKEVLDTFTAERKKEEFLDFIEDFPEDKKSEVKDNIIFKHYFSIIDPTPISWQFVIPTQKIEKFIDEVQKLYYKNFKYVNGKLPLHIGIVVQNYKKPLYVGIKALRNIRRDIKNWQEIKKEGIGLLENLECYEEVIEQNNNTKDFYSLYETDNFDYDFVSLPSNKGVKFYNDSDKFVVNPNTFDFEFMDTNTRRNDIYYQNAKRLNFFKNNRPYDWQEWQNFKNFRDFFNGKTALLHRVVSLIYSKMQDWTNYEDSFKKFMQNVFKKEEIEIEKFGIRDYSFNEMKKFIDMFEFWHTALKEI